MHEKDLGRTVILIVIGQTVILTMIYNCVNNYKKNRTIAKISQFAKLTERNQIFVMGVRMGANSKVSAEVTTFQ